MKISNALKLAALLLPTLWMVGCATMIESAMFPPASVITDEFDGNKIVVQPPIYAFNKIEEGPHSLGFDWSKKNKKTIYITVGVVGISNIFDVAFNVDGEIIDGIKTASLTTELDSTMSTRRFVMPVDQFMKIANANVVRMKVGRGDTYSVSSFGKDIKGPFVNNRFKPFFEMMNEVNSTK